MQYYRTYSLKIDLNLQKSLVVSDIIVEEFKRYCNEKEIPQRISIELIKGGPSELTVLLTYVYKRVLREELPEEWITTYITNYLQKRRQNFLH